MSRPTDPAASTGPHSGRLCPDGGQFGSLPSDTDQELRFLSAIANGRGASLELGVGSGRVARPLSQLVPRVVGLDIDPVVLEKLRAAQHGAAVECVMQDMRAFQIDEQFSLIYAVQGTFTALTLQEEQIDCLSRCATHLTPNGTLVLELLLPRPSSGKGPRFEVAHVSEDGVVLRVVCHDPASQVLEAHLVDIGTTSTHVDLIRSRYVWPSELDLMARIARLELVARYADFGGSRFDSEAVRHVSLYRRMDTWLRSYSASCRALPNEDWQDDRSNC